MFRNRCIVIFAPGLVLLVLFGRWAQADTGALTQLAYIKPPASAPVPRFLADTGLAFQYPSLGAMYESGSTSATIFRDLDGDGDFSTGPVATQVINPAGKAVRGIDIEGDTLALGVDTYDGKNARNAGAVFIYQWNSVNNTWQRTAILTNKVKDQRMGASVELDGDMLVSTTSVSPNKAIIYRASGGNWSLIDSQEGKNSSLLDSDCAGCGVLSFPGTSVAFGVETGPGRRLQVDASANLVVIGDQAMDSLAGRVFVVKAQGGNWSNVSGVSVAQLTPFLRDPGDRFGTSVSLVQLGEEHVLAVGANQEDGDGSGPADNSAPGAGAVYIFETVNGVWPAHETAYLKAADSRPSLYLGVSLALDSSSTNLYVGASEFHAADCAASGHPAPGGGTLYHFSKASGAWAEVQSIRGSNTECLDNSTGDYFGFELAYDAFTQTLMVAAPDEDGQKSNTVMPVGPAGPDSDDDSDDGAGSIYQFGL